MRIHRLACFFSVLLWASALAGANFPPAPAFTLNTGKAPLSVALFGGTNLAVANSGDNTVSVFVGNCTPICHYTLKGPYAAGPAPYSIDNGRFRGASQPVDLVTANSAAVGSVTVLLGSGGGNFTPIPNIPAGPWPIAVVVADFNTDGFDDIAVANGTGATPEVTVLMNSGNCSTSVCTPTFVAATGSPFALPGSHLPKGMTKGRFAGAGVIDLAIANYYSVSYGAAGASVLLNNRGLAPNLFAAASAYPGGFYVPGIAAGHFAATTGKDDFVTAGLAGTIRVFKNNGTGIFNPAYVQSAGLPYMSSVVNATDLNGDGYDDLVVASFATNKVAVMLSTGGGNYVAQPSITTGAFPNALAVGKLAGATGGIWLVVVNTDANKIMIFGPYA